MKPSVSIEEMYRILYQEHPDPFQVLGNHIITEKEKKMVVIRAFLPKAKNACIVAIDKKEEYPMISYHQDGFYEVTCEDRQEIFPYQIKTWDKKDNSITQFYDSYSFMPGFSNFDQYLFQQGKHYKTYEKLGAHLTEMNGVRGVYFAVWAPNAKSVSVIGSFNDWDQRFHMMRTLGTSGIWEIFVPGIGEGISYKYKIKTQKNDHLDKSDPHGFFFEVSPNNASIVVDLSKYQWHDNKWVENRSHNQAINKPMSIYEVHLGSWLRNTRPHFLPKGASTPPEEPKNPFFDYREMAHRLVAYIKEMGYTHIELLPIMEHPFYGSWGYQCLGLYAPTSRYGKPNDFMYFVDLMHQYNIGVILDWVPAHFPTDSHGLAKFDGTNLYEHSDPRQREHRDWNTYIYNYGRYEVKNFLISNALFWLDKYHIDGLRVDAVASMLYLDYSRKPGEWVPNKFGGRENLEAIDFIKECNSLIQEQYPGVLTIAEESTAWPKVSWPAHLDGLGYSHKWNMGWMHDMLEYMSQDPIYRKYHHNKITFSIWYAFSEKFILPLSHDEVVYGKGSILNKMPGDVWQKFANLRLLFGYMFAHPGKKMLFMGADFGQWNEWWHEASLDWHLLEDESHRKMHYYVRELNHFYRQHSACYEKDFTQDGFEWINFKDTDNSVVSFLRKSQNEDLLFVFNFTPIVRHNYKIGVNIAGEYKEILNSDADQFGGSNIGNFGKITSQEEPYQERQHSLTMQIPPLGMLVFQVPHN